MGPPSSDWPSMPMGRRYRAERLLGLGGQGRVFACTDELTGRAVAVKLVPGGRRSDEARREAAMLRCLPIPGVVRLLDEGQEGQEQYLVTELIEGRPFPGAQGPASWEGVARPFRRLLRVLMQVHAAGIVHGDLKPANALVDADGRVHVLDFGMAHAHDRRLRVASAPRGGTLHYLAPELLRGSPPSPRSDLFAAGVMLYRTLTGLRPWPADDFDELRAQRALGPARRPSDQGLSLPENVETLLLSLLARDPAQRPEGAAAALEALGMLGTRTALELPWPDLGPALSEAELAHAFTGPERILHLPDDAARALHAETAGERADVRMVLEHWVDMGVVRRSAGGLRPDRASLDRLVGTAAIGQAAADEAALRLRTLLSEGADAVAVVFAAADAAAHARDAGRHGEALAVGELAFQLLRDDPYAAPSAGPLLRAYTIAALATRAPGPLAQAAWELQRLPRVPGRDWLIALVGATRDAVEGRPQQALEVLASMGTAPVVTLEIQVCSSMALAAGTLPVAAHDFVIGRIRDRLDPRVPGAEAFLSAWTGRLERRRGNLTAAAALHRHAATDALSPHLRLAALLEEAECLLDLDRIEEASTRAENARLLAAEARDAVVEARAWMLTRRVAERMGSASRPDETLLEAIGAVGRADLLGAATLVEARIARRHGYVEAAQRLAWQARAALHTSGDLPGAVVAAAMAAEAGEPSALWWAREHFAQVDPSTAPAALLQAAALLYRATGSPGWQAAGRALLPAVDDADPHRPREVLTLAEARTLLEDRPG